MRVPPQYRGEKMEKRVRCGWVIGLAVVGNAASGEASGIEIAVYTGPTIATYKQTLAFGGGSPQFQFRRVTVDESPSLEGDGGISLGIGATFFLSGPFGVEARMDSVDVDLQSSGGDYTLETIGFDFPARSVSLGAGETNLRRVRPLSANLRFQSQGRLGIGISAGVSYVSDPDLETDPTVTVTNSGASIPVSFVATSTNSGRKSHLGFNAGITLQIKIAGGFAIVAEGRGFSFRRSELKWEARQTGSLSEAERALVDAVAAQLGLPEFSPGFWTARAGVAFRF